MVEASSTMTIELRELFHQNCQNIGEDDILLIL